MHDWYVKSLSKIRKERKKEKIKKEGLIGGMV